MRAFHPGKTYKMSQGWENNEPAPIEFLHGRLLDLFHQFRRSKTDDTKVEITGTDLNNLIAQAKKDTFDKYQKQNLQMPIPKSEM